jgi:hypothetical protein
MPQSEPLTMEDLRARIRAAGVVIAEIVSPWYRNYLGMPWHRYTGLIHRPSKRWNQQ